jgi:hypothetical protein
MRIIASLFEDRMTSDNFVCRSVSMLPLQARVQSLVYDLSDNFVF